MIVKTSFFKGEIYIPHSVPSVTDNVLGVESSLAHFIMEYERECLIKLLGYHLAIEFISQLDDATSSGIIAGGDVKWDELLNGKTYSDANSGLEKQWRGLRYKSAESHTEPDVSLLAYYIYYFYESNDFITRGDTGNQVEDAKNATRVLPTQKVTKAFNKFIGFAQRGYFNATSDVYFGGLGVDYQYNEQGGETSLYSFIDDMNDFTVDTYENFNPKKWVNRNQFGI